MGIRSFAKSVASKVVGAVSSGASAVKSVVTGGGSSSSGTQLGKPIIKDTEVTSKTDTSKYDVVSTSSGGGALANVPSRINSISSGGSSGGSSTPIIQRNQQTQTSFGSGLQTTSQANTQLAKDIPSSYQPSYSAYNKSIVYQDVYVPPSITAQTINQLRKGNIGEAVKTFGREVKNKWGYITQPAREGLNQIDTATSTLGMTTKEQQLNRKVGAYNKASENLDKEIQIFNNQSSSFSAKVEQFNQLPPEQQTQERYNQLKTEEQIIQQKGKKYENKINYLNTKAEKLEKAGVEVNKFSSKVTPEKLVRGAAVSLVGLVTLLPRLITSPRETASETARGYINLPVSLVKEPAFTIGGIAATYGIFKGVSKLTSSPTPSPAEQVKLNVALENVKIELKNVPRAITTESQIRALKIPETQKVEMLGKLNAGERVFVNRYDIVARNSAEQSLINKYLPVKEIVSVGKVDVAGRFVEAQITLKIDVGKGRARYVEYITGRSVGLTSPETGVTALTTIKARVPRKSDVPVEFSKDFQIIPKPNVRLLRNPETGIVEARAVKSETFNIEGIKRTATKEKPLTFKDLQEVVSSDYAKRFPSFKSTQIEIQKITGLEEASVFIKPENINVAVGLSEKSIRFLTTRAGGSGGKLTAPFEFNKVFEPKTKSMKPFDIEEVFKEIKPVEKPKQSSQVLEKQIKQTQKNIERTIPQIDLTGDILKGVKRGASKYKDITKGKQEFNLLSGLGITKTKQKAFTISNTAITLKDLQSQIQKQPQLLTPKQITQQINKLQQTQTTPPIMPNIPYMPVPTIPFIPLLPSKSGGAGNRGFKKLLKKASKSEYAYAANLASAAFQRKGIKVTRKEFERLIKMPKVSVLPMLEIVPDKPLEKVKF